MRGKIRENLKRSQAMSFDKQGAETVCVCPFFKALNKVVYIL